ncbi:MAG: FecR family protein [Bacteroidales bacterium]|nr:FecR family protein [Bacteroidales bacterium]
MDPKNPTYYDDLIVSYLEGQCPESEAHGLLSWLGESEGHQERFESFKAVWELTSFPMPESIDADVALEAVNMKIDKEESRETVVVQMPWLRRNIRYVTSAAAAVVVALVLGFLVTKPFSTNVTLASDDWKVGTPYILPDGTMVSFSGESEIKHPKQFGAALRAVDFEGKAVFDVAKDAKHPFVIHCGNMNVEVLGTSFLLDADGKTGEYRVDLYSGSVRLTVVDRKGHALSSMEIEPGERGVYDLADGSLKAMTYAEVKYEELTNDHVLDFNDVALSVIVETLEYIFDVRIDLPGERASEKLTVRFTDKDPVDEVVETIATVFDLKVSKPTKNTFVLR